MTCDLPIAITVHAVDLFLERERAQQPVSCRHQPRPGHDEPLQLPGELCQAGPRSLLAGHVLTDRRTDKLWGTSSPASFSQVVQGYTQSSAIQLFIFKLQLDFNVGSSDNSEILGVYVCAD